MLDISYSMKFPENNSKWSSLQKAVTGFIEKRYHEKINAKQPDYISIITYNQSAKLIVDGQDLNLNKHQIIKRI